MVITKAEKALSAPEAGDLPHLVFGKVEYPLNEPGLLLLHLHDDLEAAGVQDALAIFAALQPEQVLHPLGGGDGDPAQAADGLHHFQHKAGHVGVGGGAGQGPQLIRQQGGLFGAEVHNDVIGHLGGPKDPGEHQIGRHPGSIQHNVLVIEVNVIPFPHGSCGAGHIPGQNYSQVPGFGVFLEHVVPVFQNGHLLKIAVLVHQRVILEGDAIPPVALHQGGVQVVLVLVAHVLLLEGIPDQQAGDLRGQYRVAALLQVVQVRIAVQRLAPDGHKIGTVLRGRGQPQIEPADLFTKRPELMPLLGDDEDDATPLLPDPAAEALQGDALAYAGGAANPQVAVGVLVIVIGVQEHRGAVVEIEAEKNAVAVAELIGDKRKGGGHAGGQGIAARFALHIRVERQEGQRGEEGLLLFVVAAPGDHVRRHTQLFHRRHPLLQCLRVVCRHFYEGIHVVEVLPLAVHHVLQVKPRADGAVQLLIVLPCVAHVPHPGAVDHDHFPKEKPDEPDTPSGDNTPDVPDGKKVWF